MTKNTKGSIERIILSCVHRTIDRISKDKTFRPFHEALLSTEVINASAFERSFSTSFGQGPVEEISSLVATDNGAKVERQKETMVNIFKGSLDQITRILSDLRDGKTSPNWEYEVKTVTAVNKGDTDVKRVISDLYIEKGNKKIFISIKTVKPNLDQTEIAKKDMLLLKAHDPACDTFFGLFYNPNGPKRSDYNWSIPSKIFDMKNDKCVLIGEDYWDTIGGKGTYEELLDAFKNAGKTTQALIRSIK